MNRRQKIIISVTGIFIVLLALVGLTYAYFLTKISGNTNSKSISVSTANLVLEYGDGNQIITADKIMPGWTNNGENGNPDPKTFTVTNKGNATVEDYVVAIEYAYLTDENGKVIVPSIFERAYDFKIKLTCESTTIDGEKLGDCGTYTGNFNNESINISTKSIDPNVVHNYSLVLEYENVNEDQSNDMNKNLNLKVQIYGSKDTADIVGTIVGVDETYLVKLESTPKISTVIKNGTNYIYKFKGVEAGTHTLSLLDEKGEVISSQKIVIENSITSEATTTVIDNVTVPLIKVADTERNASITTTVTTNNNVTSISSTANNVGIYNPYDNNTNSLAYQIINNSFINANGTTYEKESLSGIASSISGQLFDTSITESTTSISSIEEKYGSYYWTYATGYTLDEKNGLTLNGLKKCQYNKCYDELKGKYLISNTASGNSRIENDFMAPYKGLTTIYQVTKAGESSTAALELKKISISTKSITENILSPTQDDYGTSYYYRGNVTDNYVTFNNMCWKAVRIEGDGAIKLILEDKSEPCSTTMDGNWGVTASDIEIANDVSFGFTQYSFTNGTNSYKADYELLQSSYISGGKINTYNFALQTWYEKMFTTEADARVKTTKICVGDLNTKYDKGGNIKTEAQFASELERLGYNDWNFEAWAKIRSLRESSLKCNGYSNNEYKVYTLTTDEMVHAGATLSANPNMYLINNWHNTVVQTNIPSLNKTYSNQGTENIFYLAYNGQLNSRAVNDSSGIGYFGYYRPVISLNNNIEATGSGTLSNPYVIQ